MRFLIFILISCCYLGPLGATKNTATEKPSENQQVVNSIFKRYWSSDSILMDIKKKSIVGLLGKEILHEGKLLFSKGNLRIDFIQPEKTSIVFNEKQIIILKPILKGKKENMLVTIINRSKASKEHALIGLLFGDEKVWNKLELVKEAKNNDLMSMHFVPKKNEKKSLPGVERVAIVIDKLAKKIIAVKQWDDLENEVQFTFSSLIFDLKLPKDIFNPTWPKGSSVTRL